MGRSFGRDSGGERFRAAVREEQPLQVVGAINAYTARLAEAAGFRAIYLSGGGWRRIRWGFRTWGSARWKMC